MNAQQLNVNATSFEGNKPKKVGNKGGFRAQYAGSLATLPMTPLSIAALAGMKHLNKLSSDELIKVKGAADAAMEQSGVLKKGVELIRVADRPSTLKEAIIPDFSGMFASDRAPSKAFDALKQEMSLSLDKGLRGKLIKKLGNKELVSEMGAGIQISMFEKANNAAFLPKVNKILVPENHLALSSFHEIGHAMNANLSKVGAILQKGRGLSALAGLVLLVAAFGRKKEETEDKKLNPVDKTINFIRSNAGKLSALCFAPMLIEEAMATAKGNGLAKKLLDPALLKKVKLGNAAGLASYAVAAAAAALSAVITVKIKDKIQAKHEAKVAEHNKNLAA